MPSCAGDLTEFTPHFATFYCLTIKTKALVNELFGCNVHEFVIILTRKHQNLMREKTSQCFLLSGEMLLS